MNGLDRFIKAQEKDYEIALYEIKSGYKKSHWMWYIFPQIIGLGYSVMSEFYGIKDLNEAKEYLKNEILGKRLIEISNELLELDTNNPIQIFGEIDSMKLKSCMTLFDYISEDENVFNKVIKKFYNGGKDIKTIGICNRIMQNNIAVKDYTKTV